MKSRILEKRKMEVAAATCLHWSQPAMAHSTSSSQTLAVAASGNGVSRRRGGKEGNVVRTVVKQQLDRSTFLGKPTAAATGLLRTRSCELIRSKALTIRRTISACLDDYSFSFSSEEEDEFAKKMEGLVQSIDADDDQELSGYDSMEQRDRVGEISGNGDHTYLRHEREFPFPGLWPESEPMISDSVERRASSVDLPLSLRMLKKKKKRWQEDLKEAGGSTYCSVKRAFSSTVFIIREVQSFTLRTGEALFYPDMEVILSRVQGDLHDSFVWLFQYVFSQTPTLMVYLMILLANFTVYSMGQNAAFAISSPPLAQLHSAAASEASAIDEVVEQRRFTKFDQQLLKSFLDSGKTTSIGGSGRGGGNSETVAGAMGGDGSIQRRLTIPDEGSKDERSRGVVEEAEEKGLRGWREMELQREARLWESMVEEASSMTALDQETMQRMVSPMKVEMEADDYMDYLRTELMYQMAVAQEPENPLFLSNYAQFIYLVLHNADRAEEYFKRAVRAQPPDAEALSRYASFLWLARKDITAAEETYLEAIAADPGNTYYAANYAHFLWNTGGEDTCFPLGGDSHEDCQ